MNEYMILLTDTAIEAIKTSLEKRDTIHARIRLGVKGGSCSGYQTVIRFEDDKPRSTDIEFFINGIRVLVDKKSIVILNGMILDYKKTLMEQGYDFKIPGVKGHCGCRKSFSF
jgi:iron-sulfur cluster assembly protein